MIQYTIGEIIKRERKAQKISQEKLAEGICTPSWLSKIETGTCIPTIATFELLMQRLGKNTSQYIYYKSDTEIEIDHLKIEIRQFYASKEWTHGEKQLLRLKEIVRKEHQLDQQFVLLYDILFENQKGNINPETLLKSLQQAMEYSIPNFNLERINTYLLNEEDIIIINNIAIVLRKLGKKQEAINTLFILKSYLENERYDYKEKRRTYPVILCNLSKWQGLDRNLVACLATCDEGIEFCIKSNVLSALPHLLFNKACVLIELESPKLAEEYMKQAYYIFKVMKEEALAQIIIDYGIEKLGKNIIEIG